MIPCAVPEGELIKGGGASSQKDQRYSSGTAGIGLRNTFRAPLRGALRRRGTWNKFLSALLPQTGSQGIQAGRPAPRPVSLGLVMNLPDILTPSAMKLFLRVLRDSV